LCIPRWGKRRSNGALKKKGSGKGPSEGGADAGEKEGESEGPGEGQPAAKKAKVGGKVRGQGGHACCLVSNRRVLALWIFSDLTNARFVGRGTCQPATGCLQRARSWGRRGVRG